MVVVKQCSFDELYNNHNFKQIALEYSKCGGNKHLKYKGLNDDFYRQFELEGLMKFVGVFDNDILVGLGSIIITYYPHYDTKFANCESLFVAESYRSKGFGSKLIYKLKHLAKDCGCKGIYFGLPYGSPLAESLLKRSKKSIEPVNILYYSKV